MLIMSNQPILDQSSSHSQDMTPYVSDISEISAQMECSRLTEEKKRIYMQIIQDQIKMAYAKHMLKAQVSVYLHKLVYHLRGVYSGERWQVLTRFVVQRVISRFYKARMLKLKAKRFKVFCADIYLEEKNPYLDVSIVGEFSQQKWKVPVKMQYSYFHSAYMTTLDLPVNSRYQYIIDGAHKIALHQFRLSMGSQKERVIKSYAEYHDYLEQNMDHPIIQLQQQSQYQQPQQGSTQPYAVIPYQPKYKVLNLSPTHFRTCQMLPQMQRSPYSQPRQPQGRLDMDTGIASTPNIQNESTFLDMRSEPKIKKVFRTLNYTNLAEQKHFDYNLSSSNMGIPQAQSTKNKSDDSQGLPAFTDQQRPQTPDNKPHKIYEIIASASNLSKSQKKISEDNYFHCPFGLGVSDGVGGWAQYGIEASKFSKDLMKQCKRGIMKKVKDYNHKTHQLTGHHHGDKIQSQFIQSPSQHRSTKKHQSSPDHPCMLDPMEICKKAFKKVKHFGSATLCMCTLNDSNQLKILNLGDSGFIIIRFDHKTHEPYILLQSTEQQHSFNTPYQLCKLPTHDKNGMSTEEEDHFGITSSESESETFEESNYKIVEDQINATNKVKFCKDKVDDATNYQIQTKDGDIIILASDGVFDNLFHEEILSIVKHEIEQYRQSSPKRLAGTATLFNTQIDTIKKQKLADSMAANIVSRAEIKSKQKLESTPFELKVHEFNSQQRAKGRKKLLPEWKGGKKDDICAVVGFINKIKSKFTSRYAHHKSIIFSSPSQDQI